MMPTYVSGVAAAALALTPSPAGNPGPDLAPTAITFDASAATVGHRVEFDSGVTNDGDTATGGFNVKWRVDSREVGAYGSHEGVPRNAVMMDGNSRFAWTFDSPGLHYVEFTVDADGHVAESDEDDNIRIAVVNVRGAATGGSPGTRLLGGVDLRAYCVAKGYEREVLQGDTAYDWRCEADENERDHISMTDACRWQYGTADVIDRVADFHNPYSWQCWGAGTDTSETSVAG